MGEFHKVTQLAYLCNVRICICKEKCEKSICKEKTKILYYKDDEHIFFQYEINVTLKVKANTNGKMWLGSKRALELKS